MTFGPDRKLYIFIGDVGRRGWMQNLQCGPTAQCPGAVVADDQFGGPRPDNAHLTGVILRLNDDGSTPEDNPLRLAGDLPDDEARRNVRKIFAYGLRNSFGMDFDPVSGDLWLEQNGDDTFTEVNRVEPGMNGGWVQIMGPVSRIAQFKAIETRPSSSALQQMRWPPTNIADNAAERRCAAGDVARLALQRSGVQLEVRGRPGRARLHARIARSGRSTTATCSSAPPATFSKADTSSAFNLTGNRRRIAVDDPRLEDRVADNLAKHEITESETLLFGRNFGVGTDIETGPNGNLFVVSLTKGTVYEIHRLRPEGQR